jgi:hypothetical protein
LNCRVACKPVVEVVMNEKTTDQIEEDEMVSDEAIEAAAMKEGAGAWTFVCTIDCNVIEPGP